LSSCFERATGFLSGIIYLVYFGSNFQLQPVRRPSKNSVLQQVVLEMLARHGIDPDCFSSK
jgi:hypothetical protein